MLKLEFQNNIWDCCLKHSQILLKRNITYKEKQLTVPLYEAIVRPHLENCIHSWLPDKKKNRKIKRITKIE